MRAKTCIALFASLAVSTGKTLAQTWRTAAPMATALSCKNQEG